MKQIILLSLFLITTTGLLFSQTTAPKWMTEQTTKMMALMEPELKLTKEQSAIVTDLVMEKKMSDTETNKSQLSDEEKKAKMKSNFTDFKTKLESKLNVELAAQIIKFMKDYNIKNNPPKPVQ
jgi:hypothetical protein